MNTPIESLARSEGGKIILLVIDGLGGLPHPETGRTEMEDANIPNLDSLARRSSVGRVEILSAGVTPGSGPGHLSLFGHDPYAVDLGRGVLEALGCDYPLGDGEVAARGNFCTLDAAGVVTDRRAGIPTDAKSRALCERVTENVKISGGIEYELIPGKEHRFTLILRGKGLGHRVTTNDPQREGRAALEIRGADAASESTAAAVREFLQLTNEVIGSEPNANGMLLRGFSSRPAIPSFEERFSLRSAACAIYPMYRGVARLCGMEMIEAGKDLHEQIAHVKRHFSDYDFFFIHTKPADQAGHHGDHAEKAKVLEEIDRAIPELEALGADVLMITGDHSTPCVHLEHSWHPVPLILWSNRTIPVESTSFSERGVLGGDLGVIPGPSLMPLAMAHAGRLDKYGA